MKQMKKHIPEFLVWLFVICMVMSAGFITAEAATAGLGEVIIKSAARNRKKEQITVKWEPVKRAAGYQFAYKKTTERKYIIRNIKKTSQTFSAGSAEAYKIKVRAYRNIKSNGRTKTYYGSWSDVKLEKVDEKKSMIYLKMKNPYKKERHEDKIMISLRRGRPVLFLQEILDILIGNKVMA